MNYLIGEPIIGEHSCVLTTLQGVDDDFELLKGISRLDGFPPKASFRMSNDFPRNLQLEDFLVNENKLLVVSDRVRKFFEAQKLDGNETLPVRIINHKSREVKEPYFIIHQLDLQDCIDTKKSVAKPNPINPSKFIYVRKLVIDEAKIASGRKLFRMAKYADLILLARGLAGEIQAQGFTGIKFLELKEWKGS